MKIKGYVRWCIKNADGSIAVDENGIERRGEGPNGNTNAGLNYLLNEFFVNGAAGSSQVGTWYMGLIDNSGPPSLAAGDTLASHSGWTENLGYTGQPTRKTWTVGAASGQAVTNSATVDFPNITGTIYGAFLASVSTGTSGVLWSTVAFPSPQALTAQTLSVTWTIQGS